MRCGYKEKYYLAGSTGGDGVGVAADVLRVWVCVVGRVGGCGFGDDVGGGSRV